MEIKKGSGKSPSLERKERERGSKKENEQGMRARNDEEPNEPIKGNDYLNDDAPARILE